MFEYKIVVTRPVGAGKTTLVKTFSDGTALLTDVTATDETREIKESTTVAMDYGTIILDEETKIHLYGTPGQARFDFMWEILSTGSMGLVILINGESENPEGDLKFYLDAFKDIIVNNRVQLVIGINRYHIDKFKSDIQKFTSVIHEFKENAPIIYLDVRNKEEVRRLIMTLLFSV